MKFKIHYTLEKDGQDYDDELIVEGDTIEELKKIAEAERRKRGGKNWWSERLED